MYTSQFVYCGRRNTLSISNIPPHRKTFEGTVICNVEHRAGECGAPPTGTFRNYAIIISPKPDNGVGAESASR